jgi:hypothetical protein
LEADESAEFELYCVAEEFPPCTSPPAMETGTLALTPF